jgi:hypothetical protein
LQDAPNPFRSQDDYLVRRHRFAGCLSAVQALCKNGNNSIRLWINIDLASICISGYAQLFKPPLHQ